MSDLEDAIDLRQVPARTSGEICHAEPLVFDPPAENHLGRGQGRKRCTMVARRRRGDLLTAASAGRDCFLRGVHGASQCSGRFVHSLRTPTSPIPVKLRVTGRSRALTVVSRALEGGTRCERLEASPGCSGLVAKRMFPHVRTSGRPFCVTMGTTRFASMIARADQPRHLVRETMDGREVTGGPGERGAVDRAGRVASCERQSRARREGAPHPSPDWLPFQ